MRERIYSDRVYFVGVTPGIYGFQQWGKTEYGIVGGVTARNKIWRLNIGMPEGACGNLNIGKRFRLDNGHLPDYQPRATFSEACDWVLKNPHKVAWILPEEE